MNSFGLQRLLRSVDRDVQTMLDQNDRLEKVLPVWIERLENLEMRLARLEAQINGGSEVEGELSN